MSLEEDKSKLTGYMTIIEQLRKELDDGRYQPGDKLPSEKELSSRFGSCRSSVREALAALAYAGVIDVRGGSGYYVTGNSSAMIKDEASRCAAKMIVTVDGAWNVAILKRLLTAGTDGIMIRIENQEQWNKQVRAVRQAANDLKTPVPILAEVPATTDTETAVRLAVSAGVDAIIIRTDSELQALYTARKTVEDEGIATSIFAWVASPDNSEVLLRVTDGFILDHSLINSTSRNNLAILIRQGITLGKLMFLAIDRTGPGDQYEDLAHTTETLGFDGIVLTTAKPSPDSLLHSLSQLRIKIKENEDAAFERNKQHPGKVIASPLANALCSTAIHAAASVKAAAIVIPSENGFTPRLLSKFRPAVPLLAVTPHTHVVRQLKLAWGVWPLLSQRVSRHTESMEAAIRTAVYADFIRDGDAIVGVTSGSDIAGAATSVTLAVVGDVILRGQGIGSSIISGRVALIKSLYNVKKSVKNKVVVIPSTDASHIKMIEQAAALIVEEGGLSSHAAIACLSLGKPVIVGATAATDLLLDDEQVTLDISRGMVYRGWVNLG